MLYHFELQMAGVILLGAMLACGVFMYIRRRRDRLLQEAAESRLMRGDGDGDDSTTTTTTTTTAAAAVDDTRNGGTEPGDRGGADGPGDGKP